MDETMGSHYALQVALQTMKERCQSLQKRLTCLEDENLMLKLKCNQVESKDGTPSEVDELKTRVAELVEEKAQLRNNAALITTENKQLWSRLSKLTQDNKNLGSQLNRIGNTIEQHTKAHLPLARSKTFTQTEPQTKHLQRTLADNDKLSLELEDISLKLISSLSKELECSEISELHNEILNNSFGFNYMDEETEDSMNDHFDQHLIDLKEIKKSLQEQREQLQSNLNNLQSLKVETCNKLKNDNIIQITPSEEDLETQHTLESLQQWGSSQMANISNSASAFVCPICLKKYPAETDFKLFQIHVETHFLEMND